MNKGKRREGVLEFVGEGDGFSWESWGPSGVEPGQPPRGSGAPKVASAMSPAALPETLEAGLISLPSGRSEGRAAVPFA